MSGDSKDDESMFPEDEDSYIFQQALAAARAIHHVQGIEYDESQDINVLTDIKFLVVTVALPLGCEYAACFLFLVCFCASIRKPRNTDFPQCCFKNMKLAYGSLKPSLMAMVPRRVFNTVTNSRP